MKKRIFIALTISSGLKEKIFEWREKHRDLPVNWVADKNLHLTLIPPFYEDEAGTEDAKEKLKKFENSAGEIELVFDNVDFWPDEENPRLIRITGIATEKIIGLKEHLEKTFNHKSEYQPFLPHITIAKIEAENSRKLPAEKPKKEISWKGKAESLALMESKLSKRGSDYDILEKIIMGGDSKRKKCRKARIKSCPQ